MSKRHGKVDQARSAQSYSENGRGERFNFDRMVYFAHRWDTLDDVDDAIISELLDEDGKPLHGLRNRIWRRLLVTYPHLKYSAVGDRITNLGVPSSHETWGSKKIKKTRLHLYKQVKPRSPCHGQELKD